MFSWERIKMAGGACLALLGVVLLPNEMEIPQLPFLALVRYRSEVAGLAVVTNQGSQER